MSESGFLKGIMQSFVSPPRFSGEGDRDRENGLVREFTVLEGIREIAHHTYEIRIAKPEGFIFTPGQSMKFYIHGERSRTLSIVSAPHEDHLTFAFRDGDSPFKNWVKNLQPGEQVEMRVPRGDMLYPEETSQETPRPIIMLAGGIGLTPFISMLRHAAHHKHKRQFHLLSVNPSSQDIPFKKEIDEGFGDLQLSTQYFLTHSREEGYHSGRFTKEDVKGFLHLTPPPLFFIAGGVKMVEETQALLTSLGVSDSNIRFTEFTGYKGDTDVFNP
jgi:ferredoxin-NADP reductase